MGLEHTGVELVNVAVIVIKVYFSVRLQGLLYLNLLYGELGLLYYSELGKITIMLNVLPTVPEEMEEGLGSNLTDS